MQVQGNLGYRGRSYCCKLTSKQTKKKMEIAGDYKQLYNVIRVQLGVEKEHAMHVIRI